MNQHVDVRKAIHRARWAAFAVVSFEDNEEAVLTSSGSTETLLEKRDFLADFCASQFELLRRVQILETDAVFIEVGR